MLHHLPSVATTPSHRYLLRRTNLPPFSEWLPSEVDHQRQPHKRYYKPPKPTHSIEHNATLWLLLPKHP
jgi:hypothetical protein